MGPGQAGRARAGVPPATLVEGRQDGHRHRSRQLHGRGLCREAEPLPLSGESALVSVLFVLGLFLCFYELVFLGFFGCAFFLFFAPPFFVGSVLIQGGALDAKG